ncbi:MAG: hypothetical protein KF770_21855 [Anaerolineae bacterium]|nr:hypothetical protein [Anaerolineae bacterium]
MLIIDGEMLWRQYSVPSLIRATLLRNCLDVTRETPLWADEADQWK